MLACLFLQEPSAGVALVEPSSSRSGSCSCLHNQGLKVLVWCLEDVYRFLFVLPYVETPIDPKAAPNDGPDDESNGSASVDIMLHLGGNAPPPVLRQEKVGRRDLIHVIFAVVVKPHGGDSGMLASECSQDPFKGLHDLRFLACNSSDLKDPYSERLDNRAQVNITADEVREEPVNTVMVISGREDVDNR